MTVQRERNERADVLIVTAVKAEWDAVLAVDTGAKPGTSWKAHPSATEQEAYYRDFTTERGSLRIAVIQAFGMGREQAVIAASSLLGRHPEIRCLAMCGVCAGRRGDVALGDVIIADRAWPYDAGKHEATIDEHGHRTEHFQVDMDLYRIHPPEWKQRAERFQFDPTAPWIKERPRSYEEQGDWVLERLAKNEDPTAHADRKMKCPDWSAVLQQIWKAKRLEEGELKLTDAGRKHILRRLTLEPDGLREPGPFKIVVGPIASGAPVVQDPTIFERLSDAGAMRKVIGLEMETSAILALAYLRKVPCAVVMKGVMDHADAFKSDNMKHFAAKASAECLIAFLRQSLSPNNAERDFYIDTPKNGDILAGESRISGSGPSNAVVTLHYRRLPEKEFSLGSRSTTNDCGEWETVGPQNRWYHTLKPGPYEIYVADAEGKSRSQSIILFFRDTRNVVDVVRKIRKNYKKIEILCELRSAFIEATNLNCGRLLVSRKIVGPVQRTTALAKAAGEAIAKELCNVVPNNELAVRVGIERSGQVILKPDTAWASYYAFPVPRNKRKMFGYPPGTDFTSLSAMRQTQMAWQLTSRVGKIPSNPFTSEFKAESAYLEIRHDGYRPEFVPLGAKLPQSYNVNLSPVLHKRIAVLGFSGLGYDTEVSNLSQLIAFEVIAAIESQPKLSSFGYFSDIPRQTDEPRDFFDQIGRPPVDIGNEVLRLHDVEAVQRKLELVDTAMVTGEGRHLQRKSLDIHYIVRGNYRLFNE